MASIKRVEFERQRKNTRYDSEVKKWVGYRVDVRSGARRLRDVFPTKGTARKFIDTVQTSRSYVRNGMAAPGGARVITVPDLITARLATITDRKRKEMEKRVLAYFAELFDSPTPVEKITLSHLRAFTEKRAGEYTVRGTLVTPQTVDREITIVAAMLHQAGDYFEELENYITPRIPRPKFRKGRRERVITETECESLLTALYAMRPAFARIFEFASLTGLRHSEIMRLRKTDFDVKARRLKVYRSKTDSTSTIWPLTNRMLELLKGEFPGPFIFTPDGKTPGTFYKYLSRACEECNIPYGRYKEGAIVLHDTRHSFVTRLQQEGIDLATIQSFTGHSDKELVLRYSHARPESRRRAMSVIDGGDKREFWQDVWQKVRSTKLDFDAFFDLVK